MIIQWRLLQLVRPHAVEGQGSRSGLCTASGSEEKQQPLRKRIVCGKMSGLHISLYKQEMKCRILPLALHAVVTHSGVQVHFIPIPVLVKRSWKWRCKQELLAGSVSLHFRATVSKDIEASCLWGRSWNLKHLGKAPGTFSSVSDHSALF